MQLLQKLVESPLFVVAKISLMNVKDIFNAVAERLEKWREIKDIEHSVVLLQAGALLVSNNPSKEKVDNAKVSFFIVLTLNL